MSVTNAADSSFWDDLSQLTGKAAAGAGSGRAAEGAYLNQRDALMARLYDIAQTTRQNAATQNLAGDKFKSGLASQGAGEAVRGALIQNAKPTTLDLGTSHITPMSFSSPLDSYTPETRAAGAALAKHGTELLNNPNSFYTKTPGSGVGGTDYLPTPTLSKEPTAGFWENAAGVTSNAAGLLGALARAGGGSGGGGDLGKALAGLKKLIGGGSSGPGGIDNSGNTEDTRTEDQRGLTGGGSGVAYGPDGQPLPVVGDPYYDDASGQYIDPSAQEPDAPPEWYDEGIG